MSGVRPSFFFFQSYVESHVDVIMIDPLHMIRRLCDRFSQYDLINSACDSTGI